ncbi:hypothetical protein AAG906_000822 [Vitis piasezkii]
MQSASLKVDKNPGTSCQRSSARYYAEHLLGPRFCRTNFKFGGFNQLQMGKNSRRADQSIENYECKQKSTEHKEKMGVIEEGINKDHEVDLAKVPKFLVLSSLFLASFFDNYGILHPGASVSITANCEFTYNKECLDDFSRHTPPKLKLGEEELSKRTLGIGHFEFLVPRGHASTVHVTRGHIIRATCQAACPFKRLDARAYPLYREAFWVSSLILTSRVVHLSCFLCAPLLSPMILPLPLFSSIVSNSSLLGLRFPILSLLKQFLHFSEIPPAYIHLNVIWILMGCSILDVLKEKCGHLVEWVEKFAWTRLNKLFEIDPNEPKFFMLLTRKTLKMFPKLAPPTLILSEHFVLKDLPFYMVVWLTDAEARQACLDPCEKKRQEGTLH